MKIVKEIRQQQAFEQPKSASPIPIILGAMIAFGIGVLGVTGFVKAPQFILSKPAAVATTASAPPAEMKAEVAVDTSVRRVGRAETAPLLKMCVPFEKFGLDRTKIMEPADLYRLLQTVSTMTQFAAITGIKQKAAGEAQFASIWGEVADCVYRQNAWTLCDPDNRALAIEAANTFVRQISAAEKNDGPPEKRDNTKSGVNREQKRSYAMQNAKAIKDRMLSSLRQRVAEGRLVAADFGMFPAHDVYQAVRETKVTRNACAERP